MQILSAGAARPRSNSSPRRRSSNADCKVPTYRNHFNEKLKGIEGAIINAILKPTISKLMNTMSELLQPENMVTFSFMINSCMLMFAHTSDVIHLNSFLHALSFCASFYKSP